MRVSNVTVRKRLIIILAAGLLVFGSFIVRLGFIQIVWNGWLTGKALDSWSRQIPYAAERGDILDRNGEVLATNVSRPSVFVVPRQIKKPAETARSLAKVLDLQEESVYKDLTKMSASVWVKGGRKISNEKAKEVKKLHLPGVFVAEDFQRHYPKKSYLSHVLGFAGIDNQGLTGLEAYYDDKLSGENGHLDFFSDVHGNRMADLKDKYIPPKDGLNLELTIDDRVQSIIERELDQAEQKYHPDSALAIAMNPKTGEILGMSSRPDFDPENYKSIDPDIYNRNLPVWKTYEPGSTFKIVTLAASLQEGIVDLQNDHFYDPGYMDVAGTDIHCWKRGGHGSETFLEVVQNSCNPGFIKLGQELGKDRLFSYIHQFGFGEKTGIDLQGEAKGILFNPDKVGPLELATTAFGQGVSVTPIQQVTAVSAAINGGVLYEPYVAKAWLDPDDGHTVEERKPVEKRRVISQETSKKIRDALESVVAKGSGRGAYREGYRIGGKTGTAQKAENGHYLENNYILSFIGFAPADDPQIVVYVAIDNPKDTIQFGGVVAAPIAGTIIGDSLQAIGVKKRTGGLEKETRWGDPVMITIPELTGLAKKELNGKLYDLKIDTAGSGNTVVMQAPAAGTKVPAGSTVRLYFGDEGDKKQNDN